MRPHFSCVQELWKQVPAKCHCAWQGTMATATVAAGGFLTCPQCGEESVCVADFGSPQFRFYRQSVLLEQFYADSYQAIRRVEAEWAELVE